MIALTVLGVGILVFALAVSIDVFRKDFRHARKSGYPSAMSDDRSKRRAKPYDPDVISEDDVLEEGVRLDEGDVDADEERELQERARDRYPDPR